MTRPWTRGEILKTRPHALPAPGARASCPRSPRAAWACALAVAGSCLLSCAGKDGPTGADDPETRAVRWISTHQQSDGSFPTEGYLPREIGTAIVLGLLASNSDAAAGLNPVLARSVRYLESRQSPDGAFRYPRCPDEAVNTSLTLLALFACRDRDAGCYRNDGGYVEIFDARLLHRFFRWAVNEDATWDRFLEQRERTAATADADPPEPEDLFRAARRAVAAKDADRALEIRTRVLRGQSPDGSWVEDGPSEGRRLIGAATRVRILELLRPLLAGPLARR